MDFINTFFLYLVQNPIDVPQPNFVGNIVKWLYGIIGNYGWTVIVFTIFLKIVTLPIDFWQRIGAKKMSAKMKIMQPQIDKIKKMYEHDKQKQNQMTTALYKKNGYSAFSSCLPIFVTMGVFMFMFSGLNSYGHYTNVTRFNEFQSVYYQTVEQQRQEGASIEQAVEAGQLAVAQQYEQTKESWLWVRNVWQPDTWNQVMPTYNQFIKGRLGVQGVGANAVSKEEYNVIYEAILAHDPGHKVVGEKGWNGLLILPILAMAVSFFSSKLTNPMATDKDAGKEKSADPSVQSAKMMMMIMPITMGIFGLFYTAAFSIYMVMSSILTIGLSLLINPIVARRVEDSLSKQKPKTGYSRTYHRK